MTEDLNKQIPEVHRELGFRKKGSVTKAQSLAKKLKEAKRNSEADLLIRKANEAKNFMPKEYW